MRSFNKRIIFFILIFFLSYFSPLSCQAAEFSTAYEVTYDVDLSGETKVINEVSLTNLKSDLYAKEYRVVIGTERIGSIEASDSKGPLNLEVTRKDGETLIKAVFNDKVVGKGKTLKFTLAYDSPEISLKRGRVWEISIPKPTIDKTVSSYKVTLLVPPSFGEPTYLKPQPRTGLTWIFDRQFSSPITAVFGDYQSYDFNLDYHLKNESLSSQIYQIPLPPDTPYQKVVLKKVLPQPRNVVLDNDGNWLAEYRLLPQQAVQVTATGTARLFPEIRPDFPFLGLSHPEKYLTPQKYWEADDPEIQKIAQELKTPAKIYQYVVQNLTYDRLKIGKAGERLGAKKALLDSQKATCAEFTDLFIALCRAAGIPAREINGFGFSDDPTFKPISLAQDILHSWPEYFHQEKKTWVPVDPTWEKTTGGVDFFQSFDLNHFVFTIHGLSSQMPAPPGSYTLGAGEDQQRKTVIVVLSTQKDVSFSTKPRFELNFPERAIAGRKILGKVKIINPGNEALYNLSFNVSSSIFKPQSRHWPISILPPLGHQILEIEVWDKNFFFWGKNIFHFNLNGFEKEITVEVTPLPVVIFPYLLGSTLLLTSIIFAKRLF